ncbi:MAG: BlaI/MecI/CopY family transcriptional regulator [Chloroflexi bacterium]|nr:BlaI/MecI/CopY family transcriptional regulator [Chloroflexota bacterium]
MNDEAHKRAVTPGPDVNVFRPDRPGIRKVLGDLEAEIMELIWARPADRGTTVRDVFEALYEHRSIAYTTVMNTMARLARKKLLRVEKAEQAYVYYPKLTREEFISGFVSRILEDLLISFAGLTLATLDKLADPRAASKARELLDEIARRRAAEEAH